MTDSLEELQEQIDALRDQVAASEATSKAISAVAATLARDRTVMRRSRWREIVTAVVVTLALGFIIVNQAVSASRGQRIEKSTEETHLTAVRLDCAFSLQTATPDTSPAGRQASIDAFNACVAADGPTTTTSTQPKE